MSKLKKITFWIILILVVIFMGVLLYLFVRPKDVSEILTSVSMEEEDSESKEAIDETVVTDDWDNEIRVLSDKNEVMKEYICEQIGFGGMFTLTLYENGTFSYYEGSASSYMGYGDWLFEERQLTLFDKGTETIRKVVLDYEKGDLIYNQQESEQQEEIRKRIMEAEKSNLTHINNRRGYKVLAEKKL